MVNPVVSRFRSLPTSRPLSEWGANQSAVICPMFADRVGVGLFWIIQLIVAIAVTDIFGSSPSVARISARKNAVIQIHSTSCVSPRARIADGVQIGPFCVIEDDVEIGAGCCLENHVVVKSGTTLGCENYVAEATILGGRPQHKKPSGPAGRVEIGSRNVIREHVTIHRALDEGQVTRLGDDNLLMVNAHVAHDCVVGSNCIFANNVMLAGHVHVDDRAYMSGASAVHQFCRIGKLAMVGGQAHITKDVPPYVTVDGLSSAIVGLNVVGLRRAGVTPHERHELKLAYRIAFRMGLRWEETYERLKSEFPVGPASLFHEFMVDSKRGWISERSVPKRATLKLFPQGATEGAAEETHRDDASLPRKVA